MRKLKVTISHGDDDDALFRILVGLAFVVLVGSALVPTAATVSAGGAFISTIVTIVCVAGSLVVAGVCGYYGWKHYKNPIRKLPTVTQEEWTAYCREANDKALDARMIREGSNTNERLEPIRVTAERGQSTTQSLHSSQ